MLSFLYREKNRQKNASKQCCILSLIATAASTILVIGCCINQWAHKERLMWSSEPGSWQLLLLLLLLLGGISSQEMAWTQQLTCSPKPAPHKIWTSKVAITLDFLFFLNRIFFFLFFFLNSKSMLFDEKCLDVS